MKYAALVPYVHWTNLLELVAPCNFVVCYGLSSFCTIVEWGDPTYWNYLDVFGAERPNIGGSTVYGIKLIKCITKLCPSMSRTWTTLDTSEAKVRVTASAETYKSKSKSESLPATAGKTVPCLWLFDLVHASHWFTVSPQKSAAATDSQPFASFPTDKKPNCSWLKNPISPIFHMFNGFFSVLLLSFSSKIELKIKHLGQQAPGWSPFSAKLWRF